MEHAVLFGMPKELLFAAATGLFTIFALVLFLRDIRRTGRTPYILAWVIRTAICVIAVSSQLAGGATYSLVLSAAQVVVGLAIIAVTLAARPRLGRLDSMDWTAIATAGTGVLLWVVSGNPLFAVFGVVGADLSATIVGSRANMTRGTEESIPFWVCAFLAAGTALLAAGTTSWVVLLAPLFGCINALINIGCVLFIRRHRHRRQAKLLLADPEAA